MVVFEPTTTTATTTTSVTTAPSSVPETAPSEVSVTVDGDPLPPLLDPHFDPAVGRVIPVISGADYSGEAVVIGPDLGTPTLLVVLAHWCPHCNNEIPEINRVRDAGRWPDGLEVVGISSAVSADRPNFPPDRWLAEKDWTYPVIADAIDDDRQVFIAGDALGTTGYPFMVLVDSTGTVRGRWSGERTADELVALVQDLLNPQADV